jgi:hypothetical protein
MSRRPTVEITLGTMRSLGARCIEAICFHCRHQTIVNMDAWPDGALVSSFETKLYCRQCGYVGARGTSGFDAAEQKLNTTDMAVARPVGRVHF